MGWGVRGIGRLELVRGAPVWDVRRFGEASPHLVVHRQQNGGAIFLHQKRDIDGRGRQLSRMNGRLGR